MRKGQPFGFYSFTFLFILAIFSIGNFIEREQSWALLSAYITAFVSYLFIVQEKDSFRLLLGLGVLVRLSLFVSMPSLSDDIYRFIWDGTLLSNGIHPFDQLPGFYLSQNIPGITQELYNKLNSSEYFTIYPPINQFVFWLSTTLGGGSWLASANVIRVLLLAAEIGSFWMIIHLLKRYEKSTQLVFWFFLNPLVILEFVGNIHFEGFVLFFLLAGIYWFEKIRIILAGSALGLAIGTKLLPLIYLPYVFFNGLKNKKWHVAVIAGFVSVLSLIPMLNESFLEGMQSSLNLYFQKFEFNASFYFVAREIGYQFYGYNKIADIGPLLSVVSMISILTISIYATVKDWGVPKTILFILLTYLMFATTVHPWYTVPLIAFGVLSGYYFPIIWSLMIFVTYLGYSAVGFHLPNSLVFLEYLVVLIFLILELRKNKQTKSPV
ncbi:MAG: glycosyltransferase 87 family protein [Cyclobacteriaceae bacterium]